MDIHGETLKPVLEVKNLNISYETEEGVFRAVQDVSFSIFPRESYGLVGESGSGKTTIAFSIVRYLPPNGRVCGGSVLFDGRDIYSMSRSELRDLWGGKIGMVYQNPQAAFNPSITVGKQLAEVAQFHLGVSLKEAMSRAVEMLRLVAMPDPESVAKRYPYQLSGGMQQRALIAMAMITQPELLIMDEPTTALDVTTQAVILDLISDLKKRFNTAILYITHNLAVVANICDRIGVLYAGNLMEQGRVEQIIKNPAHPYTYKLLQCVPKFKLSGEKSYLSNIPGSIPKLFEIPEGCVFVPRCPLADKRCWENRPGHVKVENWHYTSCFNWQKVEELRREEVKQGEKLILKKSETTDREEILLKTQNLKKYYSISRYGLNLFGKKRSVKSLDGITLWVNRGFTLGIVGESGSGKTTLARVIVGLTEPTDGRVLLNGKELGPTTGERSKEQLKKIQMVFQNPETSLNPYHKIGNVLARSLFLASQGSVKGRKTKKRIRNDVVRMLRAVKLPPEYIDKLPGELSGGEKQRVAIARAFATNPDLVLLDEPLSSLDVSVQGSLINLLIDLQVQNRTSYMFISHDLAVVQSISDWVAVMYLGEMVEWGNSRDVLKPPYHPYTEALISAVPVIDGHGLKKIIRLKGSIPSALEIPSGCRFHTRCPRKIGSICESEEPPWQKGDGDHWIKCHIPIEKLAYIENQKE